MAERRWLPGFVRRRPFAWAVAGAVVGGYLASELMRVWRLNTDSDACMATSFPLEALALLLPVVMIVRWRGIGARARALGLAACALWWMFESNRIGGSVRELRFFVPNMRVVEEMLREPQAAMEQEPWIWAQEALAAGDTSFLATGGACADLHGADTTLARRHGVRVVRGTYHDGPPLTAGHREYFWTAGEFARRYNQAVLDRIGAEPHFDASCHDPAPMRGRAPLFWP